MNHNRYSLTEIRQAYEQGEDVDFYCYSIARFVFRPLSYYGAWLFLRIGVTPNQTTFVSGRFALVGCLLYSLTPISLVDPVAHDTGVGDGWMYSTGYPVPKQLRTLY